MGRVSIEIGGQQLTGWTAVQVSSALSAAAATMIVSGAELPARSLNGTERIRVLYDGAQVFGGFLDEVRAELTDAGSEVSARGRSFAADLIDSQIPRGYAIGEVFGDTLPAIVRRYLRLNRADVGLDVSRLGQPEPVVPRHAPNPGETVWSAIERACRATGTLATSNRTGDLELLAPGRFRAANVVLRQSENVLSLRGSTSWQQRARTVVAEGRGDGLGDGWEQQIGLQSTAEDRAIRAGRISVVQVDGAASQADVAARAEWEVAVRAARGSSYAAVVPGWTMPGTGEPWQLGTVVGLASPALRVSALLVVDSLEHRLSPDGATTQVGLVRRDAYQAQPALSAEGEPTKALAGAGGEW